MLTRRYNRILLQRFDTSSLLQVSQRPYSAQCLRLHTSSRRDAYAYADTVEYLKIGVHTRVIFQGFTGRQATHNAKQSLEYGTNIIGGVTPNRMGEHLGLPVLPSVRAAKDQLKPDATAVFVAAQYAAAAIEEAIEAEIPLIVAVAEHIPIHDMLRVQSMLRAQSASRLVGANSPGMISAVGRCRLGFHPLPVFKPGCIAIVAKSGTLSYEAVASTTRAGLGQSLVIGMGGDPLPGTDFVDALRVFEHDSDTKGIVLIGEIGGNAEEEAAEWITEYRKRTVNPKPIMALIAGVQAPANRILGHAGASRTIHESDARQKALALQDAGAVLTNHPSKFGDEMAQLLLESPSYSMSKDIGGSSAADDGDQRSTASIAPVGKPLSSRGAWPSGNAYLGHNTFPFLRQYGIPVAHPSEVAHTTTNAQRFTITLDRSAREHVVIHAAVDKENLTERVTCSFPTHVEDVIEVNDPRILEKLDFWGKEHWMLEIVERLRQIYFYYELRSIAVNFDIDKRNFAVVSSCRIILDDAAVRLNGTKYEMLVDALTRRRDEADEDHTQRASGAASHGIIYVTLPGSGTTGTIVNGAGLAMNTVDAITGFGGSCANFLDTGGKATSETVKQSFQTVLADQRVKAVFVNIFGGLTLCDMIAEGILLAYKDLGVKVPVVVRLRGTNEKEGQRIITESGLPLHAFDDFDQAARKVIELSGT